MVTPDPVATQLRARRLAWGVSLAFIARAVGYGRSTVHAWETGDRHPSPTALRRWADALDCELLVIPRADLDRRARRAVANTPGVSRRGGTPDASPPADKVA